MGTLESAPTMTGATVHAVAAEYPQGYSNPRLQLVEATSVFMMRPT